MGDEALARLKKGGFVKGIHSTGDLDPEKRFIMHFPDEKIIRSIGSGYGGNALLGKCHALRIASYQALEKWLAEHILIVEIENPRVKSLIWYPFPSACGKTNLAMLIPPDEYKGWKVRTIGDDIAWLHMDDAGQIWAINQTGYFGVVPGTNEDDNENAYKAIQSNAIFTNVGLTDNNEPWWEGRKDGNPVIDWKGDRVEQGEDAVSLTPTLDSLSQQRIILNIQISLTLQMVFQSQPSFSAAEEVNWHHWYTSQKIGIMVFLLEPVWALKPLLLQ